ncbi:MAG: reductive dehalogenase [Dehalogenimonas sp.]
MTKFHSTISRREFMKGLGIAGTSIGVTSLVAPVLHDLDEVSTAGVGGGKYPWWVKERSDRDPTVEIDWSMQKRFETRTYPAMSGWKNQWSPEEFAKQTQIAADNTKARYGPNPPPGSDLRAQAITQCGPRTNMWMTRNGEGGAVFLGDEKYMNAVATPKSKGMAPWQGTPEENGAMVRTAFRMFGASKVRFTYMDENFKKLINTCDTLMVVGRTSASTRDLVFEDVEEAYVTDKKDVIPNRFKSVIVFSWPETYEITRRPQSQFEYVTAINTGCFGGDEPQFAAQRFIRALGYTAIGGCAMLGLMPYPAAGVLSGHGELNRFNQVTAPDEWPGATRILITDLLLPADNPIDFGVWKFCQTCGRCADACPTMAISNAKEPSWEITKDPENPFLDATKFNNPGKKIWFYNHVRCNSYSRMNGNLCATCQHVCVFNKQDTSAIHEIVKAGITNTSLFNSFFVNMDKTFGYGELRYDEYDDFWNLEEKMPVRGLGSITKVP